ncbi:MAG: cytochrome c5 family protein, partial [Burkholderiales bacterium]|nr:cytochrome c5 family protein [Burkholderiales bacterium]
MSLPENAHGHESAIKTPRQLLITVILAFLIPIAVIILLVNLVGASIRTGAGSDGQSEEAIARRIQPVAGFKLVDADAPKVLKTGEQVFQSTCSACHGTGVAGAPKFGDKDAWAKYIKQGYEELVKNAIHGINAMPPKGGNASLDDFEVARAVVYMTNHSGANFDEPKEPAAGEAKPEAAAAAPAAAAPAEAPKAAEAKPAETQPAPQAEAKPAEAQANAGNAVGKKLYESVCVTCHSIGLAGAPKFGDKASWEPFVKTGLDTMLKNAISGVGAMPPRGGSQASDDELKAA